MKVNISLLQIDINAGKPEKNFYKVTNIISNLPLLDNHFILLPELWISGYDYEKLEESFYFFCNNLKVLTNIALKKKAYIIGSVPWKENNLIYNRIVFIDTNGNIPVFYNKIHLFKPLEEDRFFCAGNKVVNFKINALNIGFMLCYDLRFPELARKLLINGAELIFLPAEWPFSRIAHWKTLNIARAIENQTFIVSCNRVGTSFNIKFGGNSLIVSPNGEIIVELSDKEEVVTREIDLSFINDSKKTFDIKEDIRLIK